MGGCRAWGRCVQRADNTDLRSVARGSIPPLSNPLLKSHPETAQTGAIICTLQMRRHRACVYLSKVTEVKAGVPRPQIQVSVLRASASGCPGQADAAPGRRLLLVPPPSQTRLLLLEIRRAGARFAEDRTRCGSETWKTILQKRGRRKEKAPICVPGPSSTWPITLVVCFPAQESRRVPVLGPPERKFSKHHPELEACPGIGTEDTPSLVFQLLCPPSLSLPEQQRVSFTHAAEEADAVGTPVQAPLCPAPGPLPLLPQPQRQGAPARPPHFSSSWDPVLTQSHDTFPSAGLLRLHTPQVHAHLLT